MAEYFDKEGNPHPSIESRCRADSRLDDELRGLGFVEAVAHLQQREQKRKENRTAAIQASRAEAQEEHNRKTAALLEEEVEQAQQSRLYEKDIQWLERSNAVERLSYLLTRWKDEIVDRLVITIAESNPTDFPAPNKSQLKAIQLRVTKLLNAENQIVSVAVELKKVQALVNKTVRLLDKFQNQVLQDAQEVGRDSDQSAATRRHAVLLGVGGCILVFFGIGPLSSWLYQGGFLNSTRQDWLLVGGLLLFFGGSGFCLLIGSQRLLRKARKASDITSHDLLAAAGSLESNREMAEQAVVRLPRLQLLHSSLTTKLEDLESSLEKATSNLESIFEELYLGWVESCRVRMQSAFLKQVYSPLLVSEFQNAIAAVAAHYPPSLGVDWSELDQQTVIQVLRSENAALVEGAVQLATTRQVYGECLRLEASEDLKQQLEELSLRSESPIPPWAVLPAVP